ncbi:MAG: hypothetical protein AAFQ52_11065 [Chloroflexota bacterium]
MASDQDKDASAYEDDLAERAGKEIVELHDFFAAYFRGDLEKEAITRFTDVLAPLFLIVDSMGTVSTREETINAIESTYGKRPDIRIWIENIRARARNGRALIVHYEEWQTINGTTTMRHSTVIFAEREGLPNGLQWLHVHESGLRNIG